MMTAIFRSPVGIIRRSPLLRVLLPITLAISAASVLGIAVKESTTARTSLSSKARLVADIAGRGSADAIWNMDAQAAKMSIAALAVDPDYVGSDLTDDHGKLIASDGAKTIPTGTLIVEKVPVIRVDGGQTKSIGVLELRMSSARADAAIGQASRELALLGFGGLAVVCGFLFWMLKRAMQPIVVMTDTMAKLSSGELDVGIPAIGRVDEVGRMARAIEVFRVQPRLRPRRWSTRRQLRVRPKS